MSNERHTVEISDTANDLVNAFAELHGIPRDLAADQLIGEGAGHLLMAEAQTKERPYVAAVAKRQPG